MRDKLLLLCIGVLFFGLFLRTDGPRSTGVIANDKGGYYVYLPAVFIYHDLPHLDFVGRIDTIYRANGDGHFYAIYKSPETQRRFTKYPVGTALCELPLFLLAHAYVSATLHEEPDGYTYAYRVAISLSSIVFLLLGLWALGRFLSAYFERGVVTGTLLLLVLGTNLGYYASLDPGMSHPFSFAFGSLLLYALSRHGPDRRPRHTMLAGFYLGMLIIIRPVNAVFALLPVFWDVRNAAGFRARLRLLGKQRRTLLLAVSAALLPLLVQMSYWKFTTGHWIIFSYVEEHFEFAHSELWKGLMSYRKGWFVYTPLALVAICGFVPLYRRYRSTVPVLAGMLCLYTYIVFSWWQWWYGGGFGARPMIDALPLLALPLAALLHAFARAGAVRRVCGSALLVLLVALNVFQAYQFHRGVIHWDSMNRAYYWRVFGKLRATEDDRRLLEQ